MREVFSLYINNIEKESLKKVVSDERGIFTNPDIARLYGDLVVIGSKSEIDALKVGATIEDLDIRDLEEFLEKTNNPDIRLIYENLKRGSYNHLRAFVGLLNSRGENYEPQYISQEEYESIIQGGNTANNTAGRGMYANRSRGMQANSMNSAFQVRESLNYLKQYTYSKYGEQVKQFTQKYEENYNMMIQLENKIEERSWFMRFLFGGDRDKAREILDKVDENEALINQLEEQLMNANDYEAQQIMEQIHVLENENNRLKEIAKKEMSKKGLFRWW